MSDDMFSASLKGSIKKELVFDSDRTNEEMSQQLHKRLDELLKAERLLKHMLPGVLMTLIETINAKSPYTAGHCERVADLSIQLGKRAGLDKKAMRELYYAALLHDIGKIAIPDSVLNKASELTPEEYAMIRNHPEKGADILHLLYGMPNITLGALEHHERYDGNGYPKGLKGEEISLIGRIICIADCYDAMTSKRTYSGIFPQAKAREEIEKCSGTQFDPVIAKHLLDIIDEDTEYLLHG